MKIILLGPPLSGKGTQGKLLAERLNLPRLSVGALLRKQYKDKTKEGIEAYKYTSVGKAVPAKLLFKMLDVWFKKHPQDFVVDNLVRSKEQLREFINYSEKNNFSIDKVIDLKVSPKAIKERFSIRIKEHTDKNRLRIDENEKALKKRIEVYEVSRKDILTYFRKKKILFQIPAEQSVATVHENILDILKIKANGDN